MKGFLTALDELALTTREFNLENEPITIEVPYRMFYALGLYFNHHLNYQLAIEGKHLKRLPNAENPLLIISQDGTQFIIKKSPGVEITEKGINALPIS